MCKAPKRLILLCGPNGVGKTSICRELLHLTPRSAYVDSDPLRLMNPFVLSDETIPTIAKNIGDLIGNYLDCPAVETVFFSYGFHGRRREIFEHVMEGLAGRDIAFFPLVIWCDEAENIRRMRADERDEARIARAIEISRGAYAEVSYPRIDVTKLDVRGAAQAVSNAVFEIENTHRVTAMTAAHAQRIARWTYPQPYAMYSFSPEEQTLAEIMNGSYFACVNGADALCGYFCFGASARIPTQAQDVYDETALDIGLGLHPALCGQKRSGAFLRSGMAYAREKFGAQALRLTVAGTNARAIRAYEKAGFVMQRKVWHQASGAAFYVMRRDGGKNDEG